MRNFLNRKIYFTLIIIQKIQSFFDETKFAVEFVGLKSKIHSMKKINGKECNTAKGVSMGTDFDKFKDVLFNEKIIGHKMKRIQSKKHKLGTYEIDKMSLLCFDNKIIYILDDGIRTLPYFHKYSGCKEIKKDCDKKDCDKEDCNEEDCNEEDFDN